jgi:hypothetical protein
MRARNVEYGFPSWSRPAGGPGAKAGGDDFRKIQTISIQVQTVHRPATLQIGSPLEANHETRTEAKFK